MSRTDTSAGMAALAHQDVGQNPAGMGALMSLWCKGEQVGVSRFDCRRCEGWLRCTIVPGKTGMLRVGVDALLMCL